MLSSTRKRAHRRNDGRLLAAYGPWAIVTGASNGIGKELAKHLAKEGFNLVLVARRRSLLDLLAADLRNRYRIQTRVLDTDLARSGSVTEILTASADLDVGLLIAAAGFGTSGHFVDSNLDNELEMLEVNCGAVLRLCAGLGQRFVARGRGGIVMMSSIVAFQGVPLSANYAATKAYVQSLAEALHVELQPLGVDVLASAPGPVHSGFAERASMRLGTAVKAEDVAGATMAALGRNGTVTPGLLSKVLAGALAPLPRPLRVRMMGRVMRGMTTNERESSRLPIP